MSICFAFGCNHKAVKDECHFYRFPKNKKQFSVWRNICRRKDAEPSQFSRLCSCHFKSGLKTNGPTLFPWTKDKLFQFQSPEKRKRSRLTSGIEDDYEDIAPPPPFPSHVADLNREAQPSTSAAVVAEDLQFDWDQSYTPQGADPALTEEQLLSTPDEQLQNEPSSSSNVVLRSPDLNTTFESIEGPIIEIDDSVDNEEVKLLRNQLMIANQKCADLELKVAVIQSELDLLKVKPKQEPGNVLTYCSIKDNKFLRYYTGLPDKGVFEMLLKWIRIKDIKYIDDWKVNKVEDEDKLLIALVKLRLNLDYTDLGVRFQVSRGTIRNVFLTILHAIHFILFPLLTMPSTHKNKGTMNSAFSNFSNCRCIVDCTEVFCSVPRSSLEKQSKTFSYYKHRNTFKGLVACSPHGVITFVSQLYPGSISDKVIFQNCNISELLVPGDLVLADKGFLISDVVPEGVNINIPPFVKHGQLSESEARLTTIIARARIHVERVIGRMKNYNILDFIPAHLRKYGSIIFQVIGCLINLHHPLVKEDEFRDSDTDTE